MKKFFQIAAWVVVIGGIIVGWQVYESKIKSTEQAKKETTHKAIQARKETTHKAIIELADKYNAVVDWKEPLSKIMSPVFTMEVEDALLRKDNQPVLFLATVKDIERKEDKYLASFLMDDLELESSSTINVALDCSDEQVRKITQQQSESREWENYAVVAVINKVKKVASEDTLDVFVATGRCVDLLFVGDYSDYDLYPKDKGE